MIRPVDGMEITTDAQFEPGVYVLPKGLTIGADGVTLDGNGAVLVGRNRGGPGVTIVARNGATIRNLGLREYHHGIHASRCTRLRLERNHVTSTGEVPANSVFLDIWLDVEQAYGGGILLDRVTDSVVAGNDLQHQMCGLLTYRCRRLTVRENLANYNSGYGIHLFETSESLFEQNFADYCCRYEPRGPRHGHMGADATGFLIVHRSCGNVFRGNFARLGGDGFFLAGRSPQGAAVGCDDNLFEENDGSLSPNIAFEGTFSRGNVYRRNKADRCNYGFWLGFSNDVVLEDNSLVLNRQAGIAVENGGRFQVRGNQFQRNGAGVLLWSKFVREWFDALPDHRTVYGWLIEKNTFTRNGVGICLATDRDHGIRPMPPETCGRAEVRPRDNVIRANDIQDNRVGIELHGTDRTTVEENTIHRNVECNIREEDTRETRLGPNLGLRGAYL